MSFWSITLVALTAGLILVIGGALVVHMGNLVKNAYELKVEIKNDVEEGQKKMEAEVDKRLKWIKHDLIEDLEKSKAAIQANTQRVLTDTAAVMEKRLTDLTEGLARERAETAKTMEGLRTDIMVLDQRIKNLRREIKADAPAAIPSAMTAPPAVSEAPAATEPPAAELPPTSA